MANRPYSTNEPGSTRSAMFSRAVRPPAAWRLATASGRASSSVRAARSRSSSRSVRVGLSLMVRRPGVLLAELPSETALAVSPFALTAQLLPSQRELVHFVGTVGQPQRAHACVHRGQREVLGDPAAAVDLDSPVDDAQADV